MGLILIVFGGGGVGFLTLTTHPLLRFDSIWSSRRERTNMIQWVYEYISSTTVVAGSSFLHTSFTLLVFGGVTPIVLVVGVELVSAGQAGDMKLSVYIVLAEGHPPLGVCSLDCSTFARPVFRRATFRTGPHILLSLLVVGGGTVSLDLVGY